MEKEEVRVKCKGRKKGRESEGEVGDGRRGG